MSDIKTDWRGKPILRAGKKCRVPCLVYRQRNATGALYHADYTKSMINKILVQHLAPRNSNLTHNKKEDGGVDSG
jgi:hypothetical protein